MKQTRLADRLTANQIEAKNVEERNLSEMKRDMGDSHISFQRSRRIKNKTSVKLKRSKEKRLASIRREPAEPEELYSEDSLEINELLQQRQEEKSQKHQKIFSNIMSGVLIAGCVYVSILIYGVMVTDYNYNENGEIVPEVVSVQDIKEEKAYDTILYQYLQCRSLYEEVLMLDYRLGKGEEDPLTLAPLYEEKLDSIIGVFEISRGTVAASLLSAREILIRMLIVGATHFLICHNHPSGHLQPSKYDVDSTKNIVNAGRTIGIPLVDHLIIGDGRYVSLLEEYGKELFG